MGWREDKRWRNEFSNVEKVGGEAFGTVSRADWNCGGIKVALKVLVNNSSINEDNIDKFLKEVILHFNTIM